MLLEQLVNGINLGAVYSLFAVGFTLIFGIGRVLNLAHGAVFMVGAFLGLVAVTEAGLPFWAAAILAGCGSGVLSVLIDWVAFRPLRARQAPEFAAVAASIGVALIIHNIAQRLSDTRIYRYPEGTFPTERIDFLSASIAPVQVAVIVIMIVLTIALSQWLNRSAMGKQIRAVASDQIAAGLLGINARVTHAAIFFTSGAIAGLAGALTGLSLNSVHFLMGDPYLMYGLAVIVLGGMGTVVGAVVGGLIVGVLHALAIGYVSSGFSDGITFVAVFLILLARPTGLFGQVGSERRVSRA